MTLQGFLTGEEPHQVLFRAAAVLAVTFIFAKLYRAFSKKAIKQEKIHTKYLNNIVVLLIYVIGVIAALSMMPWSSQMAVLLTGSGGVAAITIGLAAQESLGNAINGMFISMFRPFEVGDRVSLLNGGITGFIEDITLRHTVVRTFINSRVIIPNSVINKEMIENSNYWESNASSFVDVTITYDSDMEKAMEIMRDVVESHKDYIDVRAPEDRKGHPARVYVRGLTWYGVDLRVSMWTSDVGGNFDACSDARERIKLEFDRHNIKIARYEGQDPKPGERE